MFLYCRCRMSSVSATVLITSAAMVLTAWSNILRRMQYRGSHDGHEDRLLLGQRFARQNICGIDRGEKWHGTGADSG